MMTVDPPSPNAVNFDPSTLLLHRDFLRRIALRLLGDDDLADEAVQRTWIASLDQGPDRPGKVRSWLSGLRS